MGKMFVTGVIRKQFFSTLLCLVVSGCQIQGGTNQAGANTGKTCNGSDADSNILLPSRSVSGFIRVMPPPFVASTRPSRLSARINLRSPVAVAASPGTIYIADAGHQAIFRYEPAADSISLFVTLPGIDFSTRLFLDDDQSLYVLDQINAEILQFDLAGRLVQRFSHPGELPQPVALIVSRGRKEIIVADAIRGHLLTFDPLGGVARVLGSRAGSPVHFGNIVSMARGPDGIYLVDKLQHRIHYLYPGGYAAFGADELVLPGQIAVDEYNRVFVADNAGTTIKIFQAGQRIHAMGKDGESGGKRFQQITGLWADRGFLYVADAQRTSIEIFRIVPPCV